MSNQENVRGTASDRRRLRVEGLVNARDLGSLQRLDGSTTPLGVFYRAENIEHIEGDGWQQLYESGVRTVVDLRQDSERARDTQSRPSWLHVISVDLDGIDNTEFWDPYLKAGLESTSMYYLDHLERMPERAGAALDAIVTAPEGGVLFHCKSGRDRTGLIALLLLAAIDTAPEEIVADYLETVRLGPVRGARLGRANPEPALEQLLERHGTTTEASFRRSVERLEFAHFIEHAGLSSIAKQALASWRGAITPRA